MPRAISPLRLWIALFGVALIAFAGCASGALDCAVFKPIGLAAALGAAGISLFDASQSPDDDPHADVAELPYRPARR